MKESKISECKKYFVRPERIVWAVAQHDGKRSICPIGWKMTTSGAPYMMAISISPLRFTHSLIESSKSFVLAWPGEDLAKETYLCGTNSGRNVDKFKEYNLTAINASEVEAPLINECLVNMECKLSGTLTTGDHTIFSAEVVKLWVTDKPKRLLCSIDDASGYEFIYQKGGYRFGVVR